MLTVLGKARLLSGRPMSRFRPLLFHENPLIKAALNVVGFKLLPHPAHVLALDLVVRLNVAFVRFFS